MLTLSGSDNLYLQQDAFKAFDSTFCKKINKIKGEKKNWDCQPVDGKASENGYIIKTDVVLSEAQLDKMAPNISFYFKDSSGPVDFIPSTYMILDGTSDGKL